jgi:dTMP kinase
MRKIIGFEGTKGVGKTTQRELLKEYLSGDAYIIPELNEVSPLKETIKSWKEKGSKIFTLEDITCFAKARAETQKRIISKANSDNILMDRTIYTGMVLESGLVDMSKIEEVNQSYGVIYPDTCIVFDCDPMECLKRIDVRREIFGKYSHRASDETFEEISRIRSLYQKLAKQKNLNLIDSSGDLFYVHERILESLGI